MHLQWKSMEKFDGKQEDFIYVKKRAAAEQSFYIKTSI